MFKKPLRVLFEAMLRDKYDFDDFLTTPIADHYQTTKVQDRTLYRPSKTLKAYHRFLNTVLLDHLPINEAVSYAYRKGVNLNEAVTPHAKSRAFFQTDIKDFFGSISRETVREKIINPSTSVPISDLAAHIDRILDLTTVNGVIAVGFSTSPPISNACLTAFDDDLQTYCDNAGLVYTRYADDIIISGKDRLELIGIDQRIQQLLDKHFDGKLVLNGKKSKLATVGRKIKILGLVVLPSGMVAVDGELKKQIEVMIYYYLKDEEIFLKQVKESDRDSGIKRLSGYISYINAADPNYIEKLRWKYGTVVIDSFLHRSAQ